MKLQTVSLLDGKGIGPKQFTVEAVIQDGTWYVQKAGPDYINTYRVIDPTPDEIARLARLVVPEGED